MNACPKKCILMQKDSEGFYYPQVDKDVCIDCHLCEKACPMLKEKQTDAMPVETYIVQNKDAQVLRTSTSGGFFTALCQWVLEKDGVVFGAAFDKQMVLRHQAAYTLKECEKFRGSKYLQSVIGDSYSEVKKLLREGKWVVFSGTPCQIEGLVFYLGKMDCNKLILTDLVCRGVPSPLLFSKYLSHHAAVMQSEPTYYLSRDKYYGYSFSTATITFKDRSKQYHKGTESDAMLNLYFRNLVSRPSCYKCHFKTVHRLSDFTIFDCWDAPSHSKALSKNGATNVFVHTEKGSRVFQEIKSKFNQIPSQEFIDKIIERDGVMIKHRVPVNPMRTALFEDLNSLPFDAFLNKWMKQSALKRLSNRIKPLSYKLGIFDFYMKLKRSLKQVH
jgi:ferredoxin